MNLKKLKNEPESILEILAHQLNKVMKERNIETIDIVRSTGISTTLINMLRRAEGNPSLSNIIKLARYFALPISFFIEPELEKQNDLGMIRSIEIYDLHSKSLNDPLYSTIIKKSDFPSVSYGIRISTDEMEPFFSAETTLLISNECELKSGQTILVSSKRGYSIKKLYINEEKKLLMSLSIDSEFSNLDGVKIKGVVVGILPK